MRPPSIYSESAGCLVALTVVCACLIVVVGPGLAAGAWLAVATGWPVWKFLHLRARIRTLGMPTRPLHAAGLRRWPVAALFPALPAACVLLRGHPLIALCIMVGGLGMEAHAFYLYGLDKAISFDIEKSGRELARIPEAALHWVEVLGGWPGAAIAQRVFMHKTVKGTFRVTYFAVASLNVLAVILASYGILRVVRPTLAETVDVADVELERAVAPEAPIGWLLARVAGEPSPEPRGMGASPSVAAVPHEATVPELVTQATSHLQAGRLEEARRAAEAARAMSPRARVVADILRKIEAAERAAKVVPR